MTASAIDEAFEAIDRADFLPADKRDSSGYDGPLSIGSGQTNSQPYTVHAMLNLLNPEAGHRALDIGSGSGWTSALLGHIVGPGGSVLGLEIESDLASWGALNVAAYDMDWVHIRRADPAVLGAPESGPFDRILVSAMAQSFPRALLAQLAPGGIVVIPVDGQMVRVHQSEAGESQFSYHGAFRFVPLRMDD